MSMKKIKPIAALISGVLILTAIGVFARLLHIYADESWRGWALLCLGVVTLVYLIIELRTVTRFARASKLNRAGARNTPRTEASALVLMNEEAEGIRSWDLHNKTGIVIGRGHDGADVDIDLSGTEYFSLISDYHAVLNYTNNGWLLADAGSKNGTALLRPEANNRLSLAPGEPVPIRPGDYIFISEETVLAVE